MLSTLPLGFGFTLWHFCFAVNKAKVIKKQSVFDRLGKESPPLTVTIPAEKKQTELKPLKPLKTSVAVQLKVGERL